MSNGLAQSAATSFWGVYPNLIGGEVHVLRSDRNNGLVIVEPVARVSVERAHIGHRGDDASESG